MAKDRAATADDATPRALAKAATKLAHDVGKYVARTAHNLDASTETSLSAPLLSMLHADLYGPQDNAQRRPQAVFQRLVQPLLTLLNDPRLQRCGDRFAELDTLADAIAANQGQAIARAIGIALAIEADLRGLATELQAAVNMSLSQRGRR